MNETVPVTALRTYLRCPRRYELEHVLALETGGEPPSRRRLAICRAAIRAGLAHGPDPATMLEGARDRLFDLWEDHDEPFPSSAQRRHAMRVLEAVLRAYCSGPGREHAGGLEDVPEAVTALDPSLSATVPVGEDRSVVLSLPVDLLTTVRGDLVAVRFTRYRSSLGALRYYEAWDGPVAETFHDHVGGGDRAVPTVATLLETAAVCAGLRSVADESIDQCRYLVVPLLDGSGVTVDWLEQRVHVDLEPVACEEAYVDEGTLARTLEYRNDAVDRHLQSICSAIGESVHDPSERWDVISEEECHRCPMRVCCQDAMAAEVKFGG